MLAEQSSQFSFEAGRLMMLFLSHDVIDDLVLFIDSVGKGGISLPPALEIWKQRIVRQPFCG